MTSASRVRSTATICILVVASSSSVASHLMGDGVLSLSFPEFPSHKPSIAEERFGKKLEVGDAFDISEYVLDYDGGGGVRNVVGVAFNATEEKTRGEREKRTLRAYKTGKLMAQRTSRTLTRLLDPANYDKLVRPGFGTPDPVVVHINMDVQSLGPVDEMTQAFYMDCYFRQTWRDDRLAFNASGDVTELSLDWKILTEIWKPDTFFVNGKKSKMHSITVPNRFSRITPDGTVSFSQRLTIHARCDMDLAKFPLDRQVCPILISSYGYPSDELNFKWKKVPVEVGTIEMAQFKYIRYTSGVVTTSETNRKLEAGRRSDSVAYIHFYLERQTGYFILQIYTPLLLIVFCSWVAFWITKNDVPSRAGLGIITVLSVTKIGFVGGSKPHVPYATAMDTFIIICFVSVFASLIEFTVINFLGVFINRYKAWEKERDEAGAAAERDQQDKKKFLKDLQKKIWHRLEEARRSVAAKLADKKEEEEARQASNDDVGIGQNKSQVEEQDEMKPLPVNGGPTEVAAANPGRAPIVEDEVTFIDEGANAEGEDQRPPNKEGSDDDFEDEGGGSSGRRRRRRLKKRARKPSRRRRLVGPAADDALSEIWERLIGAVDWAARKLPWAAPVPEWLLYRDTEEAMELIDSYSRKYFPLSFGLGMLLYWTLYLYIIPDVVHVSNYEE